VLNLARHIHPAGVYITLIGYFVVAATAHYAVAATVKQQLSCQTSHQLIEFYQYKREAFIIGFSFIFFSNSLQI